MFTKAVTIVTTIIILGSQLMFTIPYLWYYSNYNYVKTELCVNKSNPDIECNGYCQLKVMMKKHHEHQQENRISIEIPKVQLFIGFVVELLFAKRYSKSTRLQWSENNNTVRYKKLETPPPQFN